MKTWVLFTILFYIRWSSFLLLSKFCFEIKLWPQIYSMVTFAYSLQSFQVKMNLYIFGMLLSFEIFGMLICNNNFLLNICFLLLWLIVQTLFLAVFNVRFLFSVCVFARFYIYMFFYMLLPRSPMYIVKDKKKSIKRTSSLLQRTMVHRDGRMWYMGAWYTWRAQYTWAGTLPSSRPTIWDV